MDTMDDIENTLFEKKLDVKGLFKQHLELA